MRETLKHLALRFPGALRLDFLFRGWRRWLKGGADLRVARHLAHPDKLSVDVGANKGYFTFWLQKYSRHVLAFEPDPFNLFYLRGARGNVTLRPCGLSDQPGTATFRVRKLPVHKKWLRLLGLHYRLDHRGGTLAPAQPGEHYQEYPVAILRLDDEVHEPVGFIKIDVEGHELAVLKGARRVLAEYHPILLIEIEQRHSRRPTPEVLAEVEALGYLAFGLHRQQLVRATRLEPSVHFRMESGGDYVNNFVFFPK
ncbi:MAG: FkbM family methyltransferase [Deltaproteobacteria bacterium]|nr:FkbM family methyltransferase [Deltaproteobacteria bacterium]